MNITCNGFDIVEKEKCKETEGVDIRSSKDCENGLLEIGVSFRGFKKVPLVKLPKIDISPFLQRTGRPKSRIKPGNGLKVSEVHRGRLSQLCKVKLVRDDLNKLKSLYNRNITNSDTEASSSSEMVITCRICKKSYNNVKKLQNHQRNKHIILTANAKPQKRVSFSDHVIIHEVKEYHKCRKCTKIFEEYKSLKQHMRQKHKKRKCYICNYCTRSFADRTIFKVHIKLHCDICGELLPNKTKYLIHRREVCRIFKYYKCKLCDDTFFNIMHLKDHGYDHIDPCLVCDDCKDRFKQKCLLAHHISFLHNKNKPDSLYNMLKVGNERVYLCNFCDETSVEKELIEKHCETLPDLSNKVITDYKDYYFCDQCMEKFETEKEMLQHKWTHFLSKNKILANMLNITNNNKQKKIKTTYNINEEIPEYMKPVIVLEKLKEPEKTDEINILSDNMTLVNVSDLKHPLVDKKSKKTLFSKHKCENCGRYFSSNYCLKRHYATLHSDFDQLRCKVCEETFVWPSLLRTHKCIRLNLPEMPFEDARPEIQFENQNPGDVEDFPIIQDDLPMIDDDGDDYMNSVDFEIPAPIVELTEYDDAVANSENNLNCEQLQNLGYKVVMQEVPVEF